MKVKKYGRPYFDKVYYLLMVSFSYYTGLIWSRLNYWYPCLTLESLAHRALRPLKLPILSSFFFDCSEKIFASHHEAETSPLHCWISVSLLSIYMYRKLLLTICGLLVIYSDTSSLPMVLLNSWSSLVSHGHSWLLQVGAPSITYETSVVSKRIRVIKL